MAGKTVLAVGCGNGRFAEVALSFGAHVVVLDGSSSVDACWDYLKASDRLKVVQADIYALPFRRRSFDLVYCLEMLQPTSDVKHSFASLPPLVAEGGLLVVDSYLWSLRSLCHSRFLLRVVTKWIRPEKLFPVVQALAPPLLMLSRLLDRSPVVGRYLKD